MCLFENSINPYLNFRLNAFFKQKLDTYDHIQFVRAQKKLFFLIPHFKTAHTNLTLKFYSISDIALVKNSLSITIGLMYYIYIYTYIYRL